MGCPNREALQVSGPRAQPAGGASASRSTSCSACPALQPLHARWRTPSRCRRSFQTALAALHTILPGTHAEQRIARASLRMCCCSTGHGYKCLKRPAHGARDACCLYANLQQGAALLRCRKHGKA